MGNFNKKDGERNACQLWGKLAWKGYDWWWHSFTGVNRNTGEEKAFFVEYFLCNPALGQAEPIYGQEPECLKNEWWPSYLMVKAGCWGEDARQMHRFIAWEDVSIYGAKSYRLWAGDCRASETLIRGSVKVTEEEAAEHPEWMSQAGEMRWNLKVNKKIAFNVGYGAGKLMRKLNAFEMYWHAEGMKTAYDGEVILDGEIYDVKPETCYGYADKNWGSNFTTPWIWLSSNDIVRKSDGKRLKNTVFDIGGGRPCVFGVSLDRILLGAFYLEGQPIEFNFSKPWTGARTKFNCKETDDEIIWHVEQENWNYVMQTNVHCDRKNMLFVNYEAPDGSRVHKRLWNGGNGHGWIKLYRKSGGERYLIETFRIGHVGCEYGE
ncbi:MAG: hypothetical protein IK081_09240 [Lachnospiraceae bacterium]|nr:hypothetical protein [Lachnospiraceae bacterium]